MADRRMFAKTIIDSDAFLDMPLTTQALYFHLSMCGDDEGFINNPKKIQRVIGATGDDLKLLIAKNFIIAFPSGVVAIKHWKIHNYIRNDRLIATQYTEERSMLAVKDNGAYTINEDIKQANVRQMADKCPSNVSIGKDSIGKDSIGKNILGGETKRFTPPTLEEVTTYCNERNNNIDPQKFIDYYSASNWHRGKTKIKDWKACVRTWEQREPKAPKDITPNYEQVNSLNYSEDEMNAYFANLKK